MHQQPYNHLNQQGNPQGNHGGHEMFDMHEVLACSINMLDQFMILRQFVRDAELLNILDRQYTFALSQYNLTVECFSTGQRPQQNTATYLINEIVQPVYGMQQAPPKKPIQSLSEISDAGISASMLGLVKSHASLLTMSALEVTNPAARRVLASQVQNFIEMAYELFMYQNRRKYYQVPQLATSDMHLMSNAYAPQMANNNQPFN
ncbi:spore coat protein CotF [Paenibacillus endophyticus]|uniref:Spore coat protein CotF n=1 Tax=Paenibacillus endophyticus TaxID=1294268 RepID=A0A7W5GD01_9BACL|nr:spore coat protein [Paenibacillus endophyticus]MBB3155395.1 spore coat protein CotF [Paenibacillus endophyticus]